MIAEMIETTIREKRQDGVEPFSNVLTVETRMMTGLPVLIVGLDAAKFSNGAGEALVASLKTSLIQILSNQANANTFVANRILFVGESSRTHPVASFIEYHSAKVKVA